MMMTPPFPFQSQEPFQPSPGLNSQNPWLRPQKVIVLPKRLRLTEGDAQDLATLEQFDQEPTVDFYCEPNDETDYAVFDQEGNVTRVCHTVTINGTQWLLVPGNNSLPKTVYEFLVQCPEQRRRVSSPQPNEARWLGHFKSSY